jgi:hypothetical protein
LFGKIKVQCHFWSIATFNKSSRYQLLRPVSRCQDTELNNNRFDKDTIVSDSARRKLAVILHVDVIGSTLLVQQNETLAHDRIADAFP